MREEQSASGQWLAHCESFGLAAIALGCVFAIGVSLAGVWLFTIELDEAWLLFGLQRFFRTPPPGLEIPVILTSAGAYSAIHLAIEGIAAEQLWAHRGVSFACVALFLAWAYHSGVRATGSRVPGLLCIGSAAATPSVAMLGSQAFAEPIALLLLISMSEIVCNSERSSRRWLGGGVLLGLAGATRSAVLPMFLGLALFLLLRPDRSRALALETGATLGLAAVVTLGCQALFLAVSPADPPSLGAFLGVTGASHLPDPVIVLNHLVLGTRLAPWGLALATLVGAYWAAANRRTPFGSLPLLLSCLAVAQLSAWALLSPKAHVRYAWPGLPLLWSAFGMLAALTWTHARNANGALLRAATVCIVLGSLASESISAGRALAYGESTLISGERAGFNGLVTYSPFAAVRHERAASQFLRENVGPTEWVWVMHLPFELAYTSGVQVGWSHRLLTAKPQWLALTPLVGRERRLTEAMIRWIDRNCELRARFGGHSIYRIAGSEALPAQHWTVRQPHPLGAAPSKASGERNGLKTSNDGSQGPAQ